MVKAASDTWTKFVKELQECARGSRGWVSCTTARARRLGVAHPNLTAAAKAMGLELDRHGSYGWVAHRPQTGR